MLPEMNCEVMMLSHLYTNVVHSRMNKYHYLIDRRLDWVISITDTASSNW